MIVWQYPEKNFWMQPQEMLRPAYVSEIIQNVAEYLLPGFFQTAMVCNGVMVERVVDINLAQEINSRFHDFRQAEFSAGFNHVGDICRRHLVVSAKVNVFHQHPYYFARKLAQVDIYGRLVWEFAEIFETKWTVNG